MRTGRDVMRSILIVAAAIAGVFSAARAQQVDTLGGWPHIYGTAFSIAGTGLSLSTIQTPYTHAADARNTAL